MKFIAGGDVTQHAQAKRHAGRVEEDDFWYDLTLSRCMRPSHLGTSGDPVPIFRFGIDCGHRFREFLVDIIGLRMRTG